PARSQTAPPLITRQNKPPGVRSVSISGAPTMTTLTRREALLLTAAATAVSTAVQSSAAAEAPPAAPSPPKEDATILEVPSGVVDGSSLPITVRISGKDVALPANDSLARITIDL